MPDRTRPTAPEAVTMLAGRKASRMSFTPLNTLRAYWEALREGPLPPQRARIDPRGIDNALAHAFIVERIAPGIARFRIAGMFLNDLMGMEVRGMPLSALIEPEARAAFAHDVERVFTGPCAAEFPLIGAAGYRRPLLQGKLLLLPLRDEDGHVASAIGALALDGAPGTVPRRLDPMPPRLDPLHKGTPEPGPVVPAAPGFGEPPATFEPHPTAPRPYLRLVTE